MASKFWRYCPTCYKLADHASLLKRCPYCVGNPNGLLKVLPLDHEAAQAAIRIGGTKALEEMIVGLVAGEDAAQAYDADSLDGNPPIGGWADDDLSEWELAIRSKPWAHKKV